MRDTTLNVSTVGFVTIGRNEGERLKIGLRAIRRLHPTSPIIYVDSGSTDNSVAFARSIDVDVLTLDMSAPFTAARARNMGAQHLLKQHDIRYIQFFDGDCEIQAGWIDKGLEAFSDKHDIGIVSGRRSERFPDASIYNTLIDIEWNTPVGDIMGVPGDMLINVGVFEALKGFNSAMIAGEDFDLCIRAKKLGYRTVRIDAPMSHHDANIKTFSQWYKRTKRGGHAYANLHHIHPHIGPRLFNKKCLSILFWGGIVPTIFLLSFFFSLYITIALASLTGLMIIKHIVDRMRIGDTLKIASAYSLLIYITKLPELLGIYEYWRVILRKEKHTLIEYK